MKRNFSLLVLLWLTLAGVLVPRVSPAQQRNEVQRHGYIFEKWVCDTFFDSYQSASYTQHWDVSKEANKNYGEVPVSIKTAKYGAPIDLGDALRQYSIDEKFLLIIGFWKQEENKKRIVNIVVATVEPQLWRKLWEPISRDDLTQLDALIKDRSRDYKVVRVEAQNVKRRVPFSKAVMVVNPKIDSKTQRRLQCSLRFDDVFEYLAPKADPMPQQNPQLFGVEVLAPFESAPRR